VNQTLRRNSEADARKRDFLRTVRLVILGGVACAGLIVLLRVRSRLAASNREPAVRSESGRTLTRRRTGRVLQLESPDRHAPETRR
jgi:hypothetical protein